MTHRLFVYGTLMPGEINASFLDPLMGSWRRGRVRGALSLQGWGAAQGFPALVPGDGSTQVPGFVLEAERLSDFLGQLDTFEGEEYERRLTTVELDDGRLVSAYAYFGRVDGEI